LILAVSGPASLLCRLLQLYVLILFVRIVLSWFPIAPGGVMESIYRLLFAVTEPLLRPLRGLLPPVRLGAAALDLSPILLFVGIAIIQNVLCH